jgi:hypothetical protein
MEVVEMTTTTAPVDQRERLEIIWNTITRDAARSRTSPDFGVVNSKRYLRIDRTLEELAAMLVNGISDRLVKDGPDDVVSETDCLLTVTEDIWKYIETCLINFAVEVEALRARVA